MVNKTGVVESVRYTSGGAGNQWTTIDGVRYATYWDVRKTDWREGDTVTFTASERGLWSDSPPIPHADNIRKMPRACPALACGFETAESRAAGIVLAPGRVWAPHYWSDGKGQTLPCARCKGAGTI